MRRVLSLVVFAFALVVLASCQTEAFVEVQVDTDGSGAVYIALALDQDAAAKSVLFEGKPPNLIPVEDLTRAGWTVTGPTQEQDGRIWLRAEKEFTQLDQLTGVVNEVAGPDGPFRDFKVERSLSFGERSWQFSGTVDLSKGLAGFSDDGVAAAFGGEPLGQPAEIYAQQVGLTLEEAVKLNIVVDLPGDLKANNGVIGSAGLAAPTTSSTTKAAAEAPASTVAADSTVAPRSAGRGAAVVWNPSFADGSPTELQFTSSSRQLLPRIWRWAALVAGLLGAATLLYRLGQALIDRRRDARRSAPRTIRTVTGGVSSDVPTPFPVGRFGDAGPGEPSPVVVSAMGAVRSQPSPNGTAENAAGAAKSNGNARSVGGSAARLVDSGPSVVRNGQDDDATEDPSPGSLRLIVIETTGALLAGKDPVGDALVPFSRERGCVLSIRQIADLYLARSVGGMSPGDFWSGLGLTGDPTLLDDNYARRFELTDHVVAFLAQARRRGVNVAALGDDVPEWTSVFRQRFKLDPLVGTWISSAEVGVRVPHPALLEAVRRAPPASDPRSR